ncbi:MAG TPA: cold shock and DUF1294 domain-containing protein [Burkholderiaceae bacterium]|nr:cold shock and DUF1294 domain-containing protein [Burkholderiaceae bacterium]
MRFAGRLKSWNDDRGFGFIEPDQGGDELFVHIKAFPSGTGRPVAGQRLTFEVEPARHGRKRAMRVQYPTAPRAAPSTRAPRPESPAPWTLPRLVVLPLFAVLYVYVALRWGFKPPALLVYAAGSLATFLLYAFDKSAAVAGRWRTPESTLHALALLGGWPGALLAQQLLRHKTAKPAFVAAFWATVAVNVALFVLWHAGVALS